MPYFISQDYAVLMNAQTKTQSEKSRLVTEATKLKKQSLGIEPDAPKITKKEFTEHMEKYKGVSPTEFAKMINKKD